MTGIVTGNVAAYRKSLENKKPDVTTNSPSERPNRKSIETKITSEIRKSLEGLDDRKSTPPPVLTKKPIVPIKKSPTVGSVAGNLFSGLKQKVKSVEHKIGHHDSLDGVGSSRPISHVADNNEKGVSAESLKRDDSEFDHVERSTSILPDMRAGRAKAPKRRLPTGNSVSGTSDSGAYQNGGSSDEHSGHRDGHKSDEDITKPKVREWEKHKAPWMAELKASQAKKTSPSVEARTPDSSSAGKNHDHDSEMTKSFSNSFVSSSSSHKKTSESNHFDVRSSSVDVKTGGFEAFQSSTKKDNENVMTKSMSSLSTKISISENAASTNTITVDEPPPVNNVIGIGLKARPTSVTLRNRSISPLGRTAKINETSSVTMTTSTATLSGKVTANHDTTTNTAVSSPTISTTVLSASVTSENVCSRVVELELRVQKLENLVQKQNAMIEELMRSLKDESEKVKTLNTELEKYAQCVTQV